MRRRIRFTNVGTLVVVVMVIVFVAAAIIIKTSRAPRATQAPPETKTVVSITFDDGSASQHSTLSLLSARGMTATYYINSALVGSSAYYMTWLDVQELHRAGNEIGGHTLHHVNLKKLSAARARTEICNDRVNLIRHGFSVVSFAYPYAATKRSVEQIIKGCGYSSGRAVGSVYNSATCPRCPYAESIPPKDPYRIATPDGVTAKTTLSDLKAYVTNAESHGGGWVVLAFHGICDDFCTGRDLSLKPSIFTEFLDWLQPRSRNGTVVRTVGQVMGS
jgi:peptidoglycan/xylan/chitin deacetylase (PgdA/CDA1 family)